MYKQIQSNKRKSLILVAVFTGILACAGYVYGEVTQSGYVGLVFAVCLSVGMTIVSWFAGDKIALATTGAQLIQTREQNPYLWNMVENLSITAGLPMPHLYLIEDTSPNAFATGRDPKHASIAVTTGLVDLLENEELEGVLAHELSHIDNYDIRYMMLVAVLVGALTILGDVFVRGFFQGRSRRRSDASGLLLVVGLVFLVLAPIVGEMIKLAISRKREYLADASGALLTRYPEGLARALEKIHAAALPLTRASQATAHLWITNPFGADGRRHWSYLFATHPPIEHRIAELRKMASAQ
jgi:heat shock protein HtpX